MGYEQDMTEKSKKLPVAVNLASGFAALSVFLAPFVMFASLFLFDDPNASEYLRWLLFATMWLYPVPVVFGIIKARNNYFSNRSRSWLILFLSSLPSLLLWSSVLLSMILGLIA